MRRIFALVLSIGVLVPSLAIAADGPISRRDGFVLIWETIKRPAEAVKKTAFSDVKPGEKGHLEITYAKHRGLLDDVPSFHPDEPLLLSDAQLMLLRTRNVAAPDEVTVDTLGEWTTAYPSLVPSSETVTEESLRTLIAAFDKELREEDHEVSLYSEKFHGKGTAFGETFDMYAMTAAHRTFPHNTVVRVTNVANGQSVTVRINDRGPFVKGRDMDLSLGSFTTIAERSKGKIRATFERLGDASIVEPPVISSAKASCRSNRIAARRLARAKRLGVTINECVVQ